MPAMMPPIGGFRVYRESQRPWAVIFDAHGFWDPWCNPYVQFQAWQDIPPAQVRRDARRLAAAAAWVAAFGESWHHLSATQWAHYCTTLDPDADPSAPGGRRVRAHVETLHRFYAFWHWYAPERMPWQPFPARRDDRHAWIQRMLVEFQEPVSFF